MKRMILILAILLGGMNLFCNPIVDFIQIKMHGVFREDKMYRCTYIQYTDTPFMNSRGDLVAVELSCPTASKKPVIVHFTRTISRLWQNWEEKGHKEPLYLMGHKLEFVGTRNYYEYLDNKSR